jgi:lysophospholipase L1-like esterase
VFVTAITMDPKLPDSFGNQITAQVPNVAITQYNEGISGETSAKGVKRISTILHKHPDAKYVTVNLGTNDANGSGSSCSTDPNVFYNNMVQIIDTVLAAKKTPVVPTNPSGYTVTCGKMIRDQILRLWANVSGLMAGPDLWTHFQVGPDGTEASRTQQQIDWFPDIHPSASGKVEYRKVWANWAVQTIYAPSTTG